MAEAFRLSTGRICVLQNPSLPFLEHYHVLAFPREQGSPSQAEVEEVLLLATRKARELGRRYFGDEECFSIIYNAGRTRRRPWLHVHILPTRNVAAKRLAFVAFFLKNLLRWVEGRRNRKPRNEIQVALWPL